MERILQTTQHRVAEKLATRQGTDVKALDPAILTLIIEAVLMIVERCLAARDEEDVIGRMRAPQFLEELLVRRSVRQLLRETYGPFGFYRRGGTLLVGAILDAGKQASDEERRELVQSVRQQREFAL